MYHLCPQNFPSTLLIPETPASLQNSCGPFTFLTPCHHTPSLQPYCISEVSSICHSYFSHAIFCLEFSDPFSAWNSSLKGITHVVALLKALKEIPVSFSLCLLCVPVGCRGSHITVKFCSYSPLTENLFPGGL